ncbi:hypothetical protein [Clostridium minihomine]|uniref:hypothetical protein n=1 Tax=Clostridium minihomine TaxID=2045012 RepID=UPI000C76325F|nr:hypothetical protein [Clostridium minihomine]
MNGEQNEKKREGSEIPNGLSEELVEEIDFDQFAESKKKSDTEVTADYRSAFQPKQKNGQKQREKKNRSSKKDPEERKVRAALEAAEQARIKAQKRAAQLAQTPEPEPEPELEEFLPKEESAQEDILLIKKSSRSEQEPGEEAAQTQEPTEPENEKAALSQPLRRRGKYRYGIGMGALVMVLAFVGLAAILLGVGRQVYYTVTDDSHLRAYDTFLSPIVMQDPEPFENAKEADPEMVMKASLWRAVTQNGAEYNNYDEEGRTLVPLGDVVDACHALFGPDCDLQPSSPQEETFFEYDADQNVFRVAPYSSQSSFSPYTASSKRAGTQVILKVGYVIGGEDWMDGTESQPSEPAPIKYMEYILQTTAEGKSYYVSAIRAIEAK